MFRNCYLAIRSFDRLVPIWLKVVTIWLDVVNRKNLSELLAQFFVGKTESPIMIDSSFTHNQSICIHQFPSVPPLPMKISRTTSILLRPSYSIPNRFASSINISQGISDNRA